MKLFKAATTVCFVALTAAVLAPSARADDWNSKTVMTFSGPVEIPGVHLEGWAVLPAGTYVFKIMDSQADRHIVQIFNQTETVIYATILAIPNYRLKATDKTVVTFTERPAGEPEALRAWFYPGRNWGEEMVYPKARATTLAKAGNMPVLYTSAELPPDSAEPMKSSDEPLVAQMRAAPVMAVNPTGDDMQLAEVVTPAPVEVAAVAPVAATPSSGEADRALPHTASLLPLLALFGLMALGGALALRLTAKRIL